VGGRNREVAEAYAQNIGEKVLLLSLSSPGLECGVFKNRTTGLIHWQLYWQRRLI
jgi:hypothetical protein